MKLPAVVTETGKKALEFYVDHQSTILTIGTIGCSVGATALTFKYASFITTTLDSAKQMIEEAKSKEERNDIYRATIKELAPKVLPILALEASTIAFSIQMKRVTDKTEKRLAEATSALTLAQNAITSYKAFQNKAEKELGEAKVKELHEEVAKERMENNPKSDANTVQFDRAFTNQQYLYFDVFGNRYLYSDKSPKEIEEFAFQLSKDLYDGNCEGDKVYVNDIYRFMNPKCTFPSGEDFGWLANSHKESETVQINITPSEMDDHSTLCYELDMLAQPLFRTRY